MEKQIGFRATYTAPMFGPAVLVSMNRQANRTISLKKEVERAVRITDEKIQVTLKPLEHKINARGRGSYGENVVYIRFHHPKGRL